MEGKAGQAAPERLRCPLDRKNGQSHYGDKNHINVDRRHKLVRDHDVSDAGPFIDDLFWQIYTGKQTISIPSQTPGADGLLDAFQAFPGLDNEQGLLAFGTTEYAEFPVWRAAAYGKPANGHINYLKFGACSKGLSQHIEPNTDLRGAGGTGCRYLRPLKANWQARRT